MNLNQQNLAGATQAQGARIETLRAEMEEMKKKEKENFERAQKMMEEQREEQRDSTCG